MEEEQLNPDFSRGPETVHRYDGRTYAKSHKHNDVCKVVMAIRNTSVDGGIEILESFLAQISAQASVATTHLVDLRPLPDGKSKEVATQSDEEVI